MTLVRKLVIGTAAAVGLIGGTAAALDAGGAGKELINRPVIPITEVAIVDGGCTEPGKPIQVDRLQSYNQCEPKVAPDLKEDVGQLAMLFSCWRDNYVEIGVAGCYQL